MTQIGTLMEAPLHASLKEWYRAPGDLVEEPLGGYVIDLVRDEVLIEIQTGSFSKIKAKLSALLAEGHTIRLVHPIAVDKWIVKTDADGSMLDRRKSPRHGSVVDVFGELVGIVDYLNAPGLEIEVALVRVDELRVHVPGKAWRRKGWVVAERRLVEVVDVVSLDELQSVLPPDLPSEFTTTDLAVQLGKPKRLAQQIAYCLRHTGDLTVVGKSGNSLLYEIPHCS